MSIGLLILIAFAAAVYASFGHGGASAYLAILSLYGIAADQMATSALILNVLVAGVALMTTAVVDAADQPSRPVVWAAALPAGATIGVVSGIVGVGGGIFLSPLMIHTGWAGAKPTSATAAAFIVVNSLAGLAGRAARGALILGDVWPLVAVAFVGGLVGARLGAYWLLPMHLRRLLAALLLFVAVKTLATWLGGWF